MRVIAGSAKGHHLKPPPSTATRPTADKIKGSLFAMLESLCGVEGARVLDLYAGSGALAIEALSRGAACADLVEDDRQVCAVIRTNLAFTKTAERATVLCMSVRTALSAPYFTQGRTYDIILLDPPYADPGIGTVMESLAGASFVCDETVVVLEHARRFVVAEAYGRLRLLKTRSHGDTGLSIFVTGSRSTPENSAAENSTADDVGKDDVLKIAIYPGSFDPITNGHIDVATRAAQIFDQVVLAVYDAPPKRLLFTTGERVDMARQALQHLANVRIESYAGLTVEFARQVGASFITRGLRVISDFEMEHQMALTNRELAPDIETICLMTRREYSFLSATIVKEIARLKGPVDNFVPPHVATALRERFSSIEQQKETVIPAQLLRD